MPLEEVEEEERRWLVVTRLSGLPLCTLEGGPPGWLVRAEADRCSAPRDCWDGFPVPGGSGRSSCKQSGMYRQ